MNKYFKEFPVLTGFGLILKEIEPCHATEALEISVYDGKFAQTLEQVNTILDQIKEDYLNGQGIVWGIFHESTGQLMGNCSYCRGFENNIGEIAYVLKKAFRGQHIMTKACALMLEFGFSSMALKQVNAYTAKDNLPSQNVLRRLGFEETGSQDSYLTFTISQFF